MAVLYSGSGTTSTVEPMAQVPPFPTPPVDIGRIESLTQQFAAPYTRRSRMALREALMRSQQIENPATRAFYARQALEGFGGGLEEAIAGSRRAALSTYQMEYQPETHAAEAVWAEKRARERIEWEEQMRRRREGLGEESAPRRLPTTYMRNVPSLWTGESGYTGYKAPAGGYLSNYLPPSAPPVSEEFGVSPLSSIPL